MKLPPPYLKHKLILLLYWLTMGVFFSFHLGGQTTSSHYKFIAPNKVPGFPNAEITCLFQDSYGFVWIGTTEGLYRFNGYECTLFEPIFGDSTSISSNYISYQAFYEDQDRNLWIATYEAGFVKFDRKSERFQRFQSKEGNSNSLSFNSVNVIQGDGKDGVWIGTIGRGLDHYSPVGSSFKHYKVPDGRKDTLMGADLIVDIFRSRSGDTWIGTRLGVARLDTEGKFHRYFPQASRMDKLSASFVLDIYEDRRGQIWIATEKGLNRWITQDSFVQYFPTHSPLLSDISDHDFIFRIYQDYDNKFWVGTKAGLLVFDPSNQLKFQWVKPDPQNLFSIRTGMVNSIMQDKQHNLWIATKSGLSILNKKLSIFKDRLHWDHIALRSTLAQNIVIQAVLPIGNKLWVTTNQGLFVQREDSSIHQLLVGEFNALFLASDGNLYTGDFGGYLYTINPYTEHIVNKVKKLDHDIPRSTKYPIGKNNTAFTEDCFGNLWIGTKGVLNCYYPKKNSYVQIHHYLNKVNGLSNANINDLYSDKQGKLWIATNAGVNVLSKKSLSKPIEDTLLQVKHFQHDPKNSNTIGSDKVNCIFEDSRGWFWFGTELGVSIRYANGRWKRLTRQDGLSGNKITRIVEDHIGNIWIATENNGLALYDIHDHLQNFGQADGLFSERFPSGAMSLDAKGQLILASTGGIQYLDPKNIRSLEGKKTLYLTQVKLFNRLVLPGGKDGLLQQAPYLSKKITLAYHQDVLTLQFTALNFINSDKQVYRYRLTGFKSLENWQYLSTQRDVHLTNLFPGKYTLEVESTTNPDRRTHWESRNTLLIQVKWPWYWKWWAILLYLLITAALVRLAYIFKVNLKRNQELKQKSQGYDYVTHEFRTPLTIILGMVGMIRAQPNQWLNDGLDKIHSNSVLLLHLVNQLLDISRFDAGLMQKVNWEQGDIIPFLRYLHESFSSYAKSKEIEMEFDTDLDTLIMDYDPDKLQKIVSNVLSNALKFTPSGGAVYFKVGKSTPNQLSIEIKDTGPGIANEDLQRIFDRFVRVGDTLKFQGIGIGLALSKELVYLLGGTIRVQSQIAQGSTFTVVLPISRQAALGTVLPNTVLPPHPPSFLYKVDDQIEVGEAAPLVLIVEDNADLVKYLSSHLKGIYRLVVAQDGQEGIDQAIELVPDLIISDVMMPRKDGYDLCDKLKNDFRTSHIPIVLLTAKADVSSRITGLRRGADAYLTKPFAEEELSVVLDNLLAMRKTLQAKYSSVEFLGSTDSTTLPNFETELEDIFLQKIKTKINAHLDDVNLDVALLCHKMAISRTQLHNKLKSLTGMSTTEFIRSLRVIKAKELLLHSKLNISEIAFECGFQSLHYFSRVFNESQGCSPSAFREKESK